MLRRQPGNTAPPGRFRLARGRTVGCRPAHCRRGGRRPTSRAPHPLLSLSLTAAGTSPSARHLRGEVSPRRTGMLSARVCVCVQYANSLTLLCVSAAPTRLEADAARGAARLGGPGPVQEGTQRAGCPDDATLPVMAPARCPAPLHTATRHIPPLLPDPVLPLGPVQDVGLPPPLPHRRLWGQAHGSRPLQDGEEGLGQELLVLHGHGVPGMQLLPQEDAGLVAGHLRTAGHCSPQTKCPAVLTYK